MAPSAQIALNEEAQLFASFADTYQRRLTNLIDQTRRGGRFSSESAVSMCVEAMGMLVDSHARLARVLAQAAGDEPVRRAA